MHHVMRRSIVPIVLALCVVSQSAAVEDIWQYTTEAPGEGWEQPDAKECQQWKTGKAGFGRRGTPGGRIFTEWHTPDIWMRGEYVLEKDQDVSQLSLDVCHDEDFEVYINGVLAAQAKGYITRYRLYPIAPEARKALKVGKNVIAVHCHQTAGGQFIDVGFTDKKEPFRSPHDKPVPSIEDVPQAIIEATYAKNGHLAGDHARGAYGRSCGGH